MKFFEKPSDTIQFGAYLSEVDAILMSLVIPLLLKIKEMF